MLRIHGNACNGQKGVEMMPTTARNEDRLQKLLERLFRASGKEYNRKRNYIFTSSQLDNYGRPSSGNVSAYFLYDFFEDASQPTGWYEQNIYLGTTYAEASEALKDQFKVKGKE